MSIEASLAIAGVVAVIILIAVVYYISNEK